MHVGTARVRLNLRSARTLKDKRQVVRSIIDRLKNSFNVAVSEVDHRDNPQVIVLGIATVSDEARVVKTTVEHITAALRVHPAAEFVRAEATDHPPGFDET